jgi:pyruvate dehydrogenase E1 component
MTCGPTISAGKHFICSAVSIIRKTLRRFFEVERHSLVLAALATLARLGELPQSAAQAIERYGIDPEMAAPWQR